MNEWADYDRGSAVIKPASIANNYTLEIFMRSATNTILALIFCVSCTANAMADPASGGRTTAAAVRTAAHNSRAVWVDFPGFTADVRVSEDGVSYQGQIHVNPDFSYELKIDEAAKQPWVKAKLRSVVGHRKPSPPRDYDVSFADSKPGHVAGRLVKENDGSGSFRVKNGVISEVIRKSETSWFEITNLDHLRTSDGKYLPRSTSVTYRDPATGDILSNRSNFFGWKRTGGFYLPQRTLTIETSAGGKRVVRAMTFKSHKLLAAKTTTAESPAAE